MSRYARTMGIVLCMLLMVSMMVGCGKKQPAQTNAVTGGEVAKAPQSAGPLGDLMQKQIAVTSYVMVMKMGAMDMKTAMKLQNGKPVRMRTDMGSMGWQLLQYDKKVMYMGNSNTKVVTEMPLDTSSANASNMRASMPSAETLKSYKVGSETIDGVDCLKASNGASTVWMEKEHGLPVQIMMNDKPMKLKYEQINAVPDSTFELPAGSQVQKAPAAPGK